MNMVKSSLCSISEFKQNCGFSFRLFFFFFWSTFKFTSKLRGWYKDSQYFLHQPMHILTHYQHPPPEWHICHN